MRYVINVNKKNTFDVQRALFKLGFTWGGPTPCLVKYQNWSALVIDDVSFKIERDSLKNNRSLLVINRSALVEYGVLKTTADSPLRVNPAVEQAQKTASNAALQLKNSKPESNPIVIGSKVTYHLPTQKVVAEVLGINGDTAWIKSSTILLSGKKSDIVLLDDLELLTTEAAIEAEVFQIIKNTSSLTLATQHVIAYLKKQFVKEEQEDKSKEVVDTFHVNTTTTKLKLSILSQAAVKYINNNFNKGDNISRIRIVNGLAYTKKEAERVLVELKNAGIIKKSPKSVARTYYVVA